MVFMVFVSLFNYKNDYRMYKLVRMSDLKVTNKAFTRNHKSADEIIKEMDSADSYIYTSITVRCKKTLKYVLQSILTGVLLKNMKMVMFVWNSLLWKMNIFGLEHYFRWVIE